MCVLVFLGGRFSACRLSSALEPTRLALGPKGPACLLLGLNVNCSAHKYCAPNEQPNGMLKGSTAGLDAGL